MTHAIRLLGLLAFVGSLALTGWWWMRVASREGSGQGARAALVDTLLFTLFAVHHSILAREWAKARLNRLIPTDLLRTVYVLTASVLLTLTCLLWQPIGGVAYRVGGPAALVFQAAQVSGIVLTLVAVRRISLRELAGLDDPATEPGVPLQHGGPYHLVRHPIYLGWLLMVCASPLMTSDRLLFAVISSGYLALAIPFEEAGLRRRFGDSYRDYQRLVRWRLVPFIY